MGHIITGLVLIVLVFGLVYYAYQSNLLVSVFGGENNQIVTNVFKGLAQLAKQTSTMPSVYAGKIKVSFVSLGSNNEGYSHFTIKAVSGNSPVVVTGWRIETELDRNVIPRALDLYGLGARRSLQNIVLNSGDELVVFTPVSGDNARTGGKEWRVFYKDPLLAYPHGTITLRDGEGKVVDVYKY